MKLTRKTNKKIEPTNYVLLILIFIIIMIMTIVGRNIYISRENSKNNSLVLDKVLVNKINESELDNYIRENLDTVLLVSIIGDSKCKDFEKEIKSYIKKNNLTDEITYLSLDGDEANNFIKKFNSKYKNEYYIDRYPSLISFEDGKVVDVLQYDLDLESFKTFINNTRKDK